LGSLAGQWHGYHHDDRGFAIPLDVTIKEDGSFEATSEPPGSYRFRGGTVAIRDGQVTPTPSGMTVAYWPCTRVPAGESYRATPKGVVKDYQTSLVRHRTRLPIFFG
jgi:hypothetical protein